MSKGPVSNSKSSYGQASVQAGGGVSISLDQIIATMEEDQTLSSVDKAKVITLLGKCTTGDSRADARTSYLTSLVLVAVGLLILILVVSTFTTLLSTVVDTDRLTRQRHDVSRDLVSITDQCKVSEVGEAGGGWQRLDQFIEYINSNEIVKEFEEDKHFYENGELFRSSNFLVMKNMLEVFLRETGLQKGSRIMDIGAGDGAATDILKSQYSMHPVALVVMDYEFEKIAGKGHEVHKMDFHKITLSDKSFDGIFARHVMEHSIMPHYLLHRLYHLLKGGGFLYVEVPLPSEIKSVVRHENHPNHYSVLTPNCWSALFAKNGFIQMNNYTITTPDMGPTVAIDTYFGWVLQRPVESSSLVVE